jgi:hypothetical protein
VHQERNDLRGKIVESPEKLQPEKILEELGAAVEKERAAIGEAERSARDLQVKLECCSKAEREVQKTVKLMEEAEAEVRLYNVLDFLLLDASSVIESGYDCQGWVVSSGLSRKPGGKKIAQESLKVVTRWRPRQLL